MHRVQQRNGKTSSPLQYILQAAMGCSTLPAGGNKDNRSNGQVSTSSTLNQKSQRPSYGRNNSSSSTKVQREQRDSAVYRNGRTTDDERHDDGDVVMGDAFSSTDQLGRASSRDVNKMVNIAQQGNSKFEHYMNEDEKASSSNSKSGRSRSKVHGTHLHEEVLPPPPLGAVRTRCYRLNLNAPVILSPTHDHLGPMPYEPPSHLLPQHHRSSRQISHSSSHESVERSPMQVAINTARIFRGITVDKNGTILSQNARATRSSKGKEKSKQAASSRQQEKIDKAKDLVDETIGADNQKENSSEKSNMVSLVIIGQYDEMKQLVRDGAKKLRDAEGLPDEALLAVNRPRQNTQNEARNLYPSSPSSLSSRKRLSSPSQIQSPAESPDSRSRSRNRLQQSMLQSAPPKLKSHPRDHPSSRRFSSAGESEGERRRYGGDRCNDMPIFGGGGNSDWGNALGFSKGFNTIWNCGATGNGSPNNQNATDVNNERRSSKVRYEGRNESSARFSRGGAAAQRDAPVSKDMMIL